MNQFQEMLALHFDARLKETAGDADAYRSALEEKANAIRSGNSPDADRLRQVEMHLAQMEKKAENLSCAVDEGRLAYATAYDLLNDLNRLGVGLLPGAKTGRMQHEYALIRSIQMQDARLQKELTGFQAKLAELQMRFDQTAEVGVLIRSDRAALDMIFNEDEIIGRAMYAAGWMQALLESLRPLLVRLEQLHRQSCAECEALKQRRTALIEQSRIFSAED